MPEKNIGLFKKYDVKRVDGKPITGELFVLEIDRDPFAVEALEAYAIATSTFPRFAKLSEELLAKIARLKEDGLHCRLNCPGCDAKHVDEDEWATRLHKTHLCASCGNNWKPFDFPTFGVAV